MSDVEKLRALLADWEGGDFTGGMRLFAEGIHFLERERALEALGA